MHVKKKKFSYFATVYWHVLPTLLSVSMENVYRLPASNRPPTNNQNILIIVTLCTRKEWSCAKKVSHLHGAQKSYRTLFFVLFGFLGAHGVQSNNFNGYVLFFFHLQAFSMKKSY